MPNLIKVLPKNYYKGPSHDLSRFRSTPSSNKTKIIIAPERLSLQFGYSKRVLRFITALKKFGLIYNHIHLDLTKVTIIGEGVISMILSVINELNLRGTYTTGTKPKNLYSKNKLEKSGFFKYMRGNVSQENLNSKNIIIRTGDITTSQNTLSPEMYKAMETVWGVSARCPELFGTIGEMLRNTCDHAFNSEGNIVWHLGLSHNEIDNVVKFSFVDNGVGIIRHYNTRSNWTKLKAIIQNNASILEKAYKKGIESHTGLPWRGEGLPTIYELYTDNIITNLVVITNNVYLDFDKNLFEEIKVPFSGTYYFWKVDKSCVPSYYV